MSEIKKDERPQLGGWAPGGYQRKCFGCQCDFEGDKRAVICADCAYSEQQPEDKA